MVTCRGQGNSGFFKDLGKLAAVNRGLAFRPDDKLGAGDFLCHRQLRGEAHPKVQVPNCDLAIAHGTGGLLGVRHAASTCILERA